MNFRWPELKGWRNWIHPRKLRWQVALPKSGLQNLPPPRKGGRILTLNLIGRAVVSQVISLLFGSSKFLKVGNWWECGNQEFSTPKDYSYLPSLWPFWGLLSDPKRKMVENVTSFPKKGMKVWSRMFHHVVITWNAFCVLFFWATLPLKPATIALKIGHLAFQVPGNSLCPFWDGYVTLSNG